MKNLRILAVVILSAFIISCGGSSDGNSEKENAISELNEMQEQLKEMADQAEKIQKEEENESEEDKKIYSQKNIELLGLSVEERKIADSTWQKAKVLAENYKSLEKEELRALTPESINQMILDAGFKDLDQAKVELQKIADSRDFDISVAMKFASIHNSRMLDGEETFKKEAKELGQKINEKGYSAEDLKALDENSKITVPITEILWRLNN
jgi:hypothetical protein